MLVLVVMGAAGVGDQAAEDQAAADRADDAAEESHRLTALEGLAALSLDALSSVAYGPEAIVIVLAAAGTAGLGYTLPVTLAIVVLLAVLVISYRQVIEAFPGGGGAYAVAKTHLGTSASLVAAGSLVVDYVLNAAVGVSAGVEALVSAFPSLYGGRVEICLAILALITAANLWGAADSARLFIAPTVIFIVAIFAVIISGLIRSHPAVAPSHQVPSATETIGLLLLLRAFASGCAALTGVEAIANAVPSFRPPRPRRAQHTEMWLGIILGTMLIGLSILIRKYQVTPTATETVLAELTAAGLGHNFVFYAVQMITTILLALAANTSFGGLPILASLLATDNFLPHLFFLRADRQVHRYGIGVLAVAAALLLIVSRGHPGPGAAVRHRRVRRVHPVAGRDGAALAPAARAGLGPPGRDQRRRRRLHPGRARHRAVLQVPGGRLARGHRGAADGAAVPADLVGLQPDRVGAGAGRDPGPAAAAAALVVVPVARMSRLTEAGISAALSLGDEVRAVTVCYHDEADEEADARFRAQWEAWHPDVPLISLLDPAPGARAAHRRVPARAGARRDRGPGRRADPRGAAVEPAAPGPVQPARRRARPGYPARHR